MKPLFNFICWEGPPHNIYMNMGYEEAILKLAEDGIASVRVFEFYGNGSILGYRQAPDVVKDWKIPVTRRFTGGSHIYVSDNVLGYSFAVPWNHIFSSCDDMREYIAETLVKSLGKIGIDARADNKAATIEVDTKYRKGVLASHVIGKTKKAAILHGVMNIDRYPMNNIERSVQLGRREINDCIYREYDALRNAPVVLELIDPERGLSKKSVKKAIAKSLFTELKNGDCNPIPINNHLKHVAFEMVCERYVSLPWIIEKNPPFYEEVQTPGESNGTLKSGLGYCMFLQVSNNRFREIAQPIQA